MMIIVVCLTFKLPIVYESLASAGEFLSSKIALEVETEDARI